MNLSYLLFQSVSAIRSEEENNTNPFIYRIKQESNKSLEKSDLLCEVCNSTVSTNVRDRENKIYTIKNDIKIPRDVMTPESATFQLFSKNTYIIMLILKLSVDGYIND
ncbi:uncharacterized protein VNE69_07123 [Vairimorpha necatrix]|uniref:Uncharacterized protein n=1 Tax=Vairimorpha necatrix TaxID=6039 RepID=A0AAX4JDG9_9MICR